MSFRHALLGAALATAFAGSSGAFAASGISPDGTAAWTTDADQNLNTGTTGSFAPNYDVYQSAGPGQSVTVKDKNNADLMTFQGAAGANSINGTATGGGAGYTPNGYTIEDMRTPRYARINNDNPNDYATQTTSAYSHFQLDTYNSATSSITNILYAPREYFSALIDASVGSTITFYRGGGFGYNSTAPAQTAIMTLSLYDIGAKYYVHQTGNYQTDPSATMNLNVDFGTLGFDGWTVTTGSALGNNVQTTVNRAYIETAYASNGTSTTYTGAGFNYNASLHSTAGTGAADADVPEPTLLGLGLLGLVGTIGLARRPDRRAAL